MPRWRGANFERTQGISLHWSISAAAGNPRFVFRWQEHGGPAVSQPKRTSFGSRLLQNSIRDLDHPAELDYASDGLIYSLDAPQVKATTLAGIQVFVAEDEPILLWALEEVLEGLGCTIAGTATRVT